MVGAVKPKLGHCHLRKLFDRKESSAPIKLFLQLLSFKKVSCLFIPLFPRIYIPTWGFRFSPRNKNIFGSIRKISSSSFVVVDKVIDIIIRRISSIRTYCNRHGEGFKISRNKIFVDERRFQRIVGDEISSILGPFISEKNMRDDEKSNVYPSDLQGRDRSPITLKTIG